MQSGWFLRARLADSYMMISICFLEWAALFLLGNRAAAAKGGLGISAVPMNASTSSAVSCPCKWNATSSSTDRSLSPPIRPFSFLFPGVLIPFETFEKIMLPAWDFEWLTSQQEDIILVGGSSSVRESWHPGEKKLSRLRSFVFSQWQKPIVKRSQILWIFYFCTRVVAVMWIIDRTTKRLSHSLMRSFLRYEE